ncbi:MAG: cation-transporting P-type ATPase [Methylococcaceae bacterium]|nr:MAG: cation-transporting P-type ATPase [Methylococcaceae bacterium]
MHTQVSGRARFKVAGLYRCESFGRELQDSLARLGYVEAIKINVLTGCVVVHYRDGQPLAELVAELEAQARRFTAAVQPPPGRKKRTVKAAASSRDHQGYSKAAPLPAAAPAGLQAQQTWHALPVQDLLQNLQTGSEGLAATEAASRLARYGGNVLAEARRRSALAMFGQQFTSPPVFMLGISAAVSVATGGMADAVVILSVVFINAVIGYATESSAERTIDALGKMTPEQAQVLRDGQPCAVPLAHIVPGDVLVLTPGTYIAADARLLASNRLTVDESALTGESLPVSKHYQFPADENAPLAERHNMVHRGTVVTGGSGLALVTATGRNTEIGVIQSLVGEVRTPETPMQRQLDRMGTQLAWLSGGICAAMFGIGVLRGYGWLQMLNSSISLAVAAVPEGLPAVATTTLALGIKDMQRQHVLVRQLPAVESLGSVQVICLDKTGTLTMNRMKAVAIECGGLSLALDSNGFLSEGRPLPDTQQTELLNLLEVVSLCSETELSGQGATIRVDGSPTETALVEAALLADIDVVALRAANPLVRTVHRAENRPYMVTVHQRDGGDSNNREANTLSPSPSGTNSPGANLVEPCSPEGQRAGLPGDKGRGEGLFVAVKGSPSDVLELCRWRQVDGRLLELDEAGRAALLTRNDRMAGQALRVLAVACGSTDDAEKLPELVWLGLAGMEDQIRPGMAELMDQFHQAGIDTVMITGDQSATAYSVGKRLGLSGDQPLEIIDSSGLDKLEPEVLGSLAKHTAVFARVSPAHKLRIVQALQGAGRVVAMTGDGVNDSPALKAADVGVAMGDQGTEVARSVADVVLEDDNLHTMIIAIRQGRCIYANIRKSLHYMLSSNLSEIEIMLFGTVLGLGEVLNPMQLLWINLMTDILPGLALALEPPEQNVLLQPPRDPGEPIVRRADAGKLIGQSLGLTAGALGAYGLTVARSGLGPAAGTNAFMTLTLGQLLHSLCCRSERTGLFNPEGRASNPYLRNALAASLAIQVGAGFFPPLRSLLRLTPIGPADWLSIAAGAGLPLLVNEVSKLGKKP